MNHISNLLNTTKINHDYEQSIPELDPITIQIVDEIFIELQGLIPAYAYTWSSVPVVNACKMAWIRAFMYANLTDLNMINHGLNELSIKKSTFMPSPGEFIELCKPSPESLGIPNLEKAYDEACKNSHFSKTEKQWSHKAVFHAWKETGSYALSHFPRSQSFPMFKRNYEITINHITNGQHLTEIPLGINNHASSSTTPSFAESELTKMKKILGMK